MDEKDKNIKNEFEIQFVKHLISLKDEHFLFNEILFINSCLKIKKKKEFLDFIFSDAFKDLDYNRFSDMKDIKNQLITIKKLLTEEIEKRRTN